MGYHAKRTIPRPFGYCGEYLNSESGLIYLRNRYYDSAIGAFITEDPIKDGLNWYAYCGGNPISFVDPSGCIKDEDIKYGIDSTVYESLVTLGEAWGVFENYRLDIENLANKIRNIADSMGAQNIDTLIETYSSQLEELNEAERVLAVSDIFAAAFIGLARADAENATEEMFPGEVNIDDGEANAYKHAMWNMYGTIYAGITITKYFTDAHEFANKYNFLPEEQIKLDMDMNNNQYGRMAGKSGDEKRGKLIVGNYLYSGELLKILNGAIVPTNGNLTFGG